MNLCERGHKGCICIMINQPLFSANINLDKLSCYICDREGAEQHSTVSQSYVEYVRSCKHEMKGRIWCEGNMRCCSCDRCGLIIYWHIPSGFVCTDHEESGEIFIQTYKGEPEQKAKPYYIRCPGCGIPKVITKRDRLKKNEVICSVYLHQIDFIDRCKHIFSNKQSQYATIQGFYDYSSPYAMGYTDKRNCLEYDIQRCLVCGLNKLEIDVSKDFLCLCTACQQDPRKCSCENQQANAKGRSTFCNFRAHCSKCNSIALNCTCQTPNYVAKKVD